MVFLVPQLDKKYFDCDTDSDGLNSYEKAKIGDTYPVGYTLFKHYIENNPHVLVKKLPTKLLIKLLKRQIENKRKNLKNNKDENEILFSDRNLSNAIRSDLSQSSAKIPEELFATYQRSFNKD